MKEVQTMLSRMFVSVSLVCLIGLAEARTAPAPDPLKLAMEEVRRAEKELEDLERECVEQRVKARLLVAAKAEQLHAFEQVHGRNEREVAELRDKERLLEKLQAVIANPDKDPQMLAVRKEIDELRMALEKRATYRNAGQLSRQKALILAEETLRFLDQRQAHRRLRAQARLEGAEARVEALRGGRPLEGPTERRLRELERKVDELLRKLDRSPDEKK